MDAAIVFKFVFFRQGREFQDREVISVFFNPQAASRVRKEKQGG